MPILVLVPAILALIGRGDVADQLQFGFAHLVGSSFGLFGWAIGFFYAALGIFLSFLYLDRRENTFCMPLFSCSSLLSGIVATYLLMWWVGGPPPNNVQLSAAFLIIAALLVMSPLHHLPLYLRQLRVAVAEKRLRLITLVCLNPDGESLISQELAASVITVDINPLRNVLRKRTIARRAGNT